MAPVDGDLGAKGADSPGMPHGSARLATLKRANVRFTPESGH
jgi:hypothetical protein